MNAPISISSATVTDTAALSHGGLPTVSVIVPVFNGVNTLPGLLAALDAQRYPAELVQVIIADDASTDGTFDLLRNHGDKITVVRADTNRGSYAARNLALQVAHGDVVAFTDADCLPDPDWLSEGVKAIQRQSGGLVAGAVCIDPIKPDSAVQRYDQAFGIQQAFFALRQGFGATANLFAAREVFARVPGFDAELRSGGDRKFCKDCTAAGAAFSYAPDSRVRHEPRISFRDLAVKQIRVSIGHVSIFPLWSRYRIMPLRLMPRETFDLAKFLREEPLLFRLRFRGVYYALELIHLLAYGQGCLRRSLGRFGSRGGRPS